MARWRAYVTHMGTTQEIVIVGKSINLTRSRSENDYGGYWWEKKLSQFSVVRKGDNAGYDFLITIDQSSNRCEPCTIELRRYTSGSTYSVAYTGEFSMNDCDFDLDLCVITISTKQTSIYNCIDKKKDVDFNILNIGSAHSASIFDYLGSTQGLWGSELADVGQLEFSVLLNPLTPDGDEWQLIDSTTLNGSAVNIYARFFAFTSCIAGVAQTPPSLNVPGVGFIELPWVLDIDCVGSDTGEQTAKWVVGETLENSGFTFAAILSSAITLTTSCPWINALWQFTDVDAQLPSPTGDCWTIGINVVNDYLSEIPNGRKLSEVLEGIISRNTEDCDTQITTVVSDFFQINPENVSDNNYVTNEYNYWEDPIIFDAYDFIAPDADEQSSIGIVTFKKLMSDLEKMFQVVWWVEQDGADYVLRIEHWSVAETGSSYNITSANMSSKKYNYQKGYIKERKKFTMLAQRNMDFVGTEITYQPLCTIAETEDVNLELFCTDIDFLRAHPEVVNGSMLVMCSWKSDSSRIWRHFGALSGSFVSNAPMSWANLHEAFHMHRANTMTGTMNNDSVTFSSTVKIRERRLILKDCGLTLFDYNYATLPNAESAEIQEVRADLFTETAQIILKS